jgi:hypothetical protein
MMKMACQSREHKTHDNVKNDNVLFIEYENKISNSLNIKLVFLFSNLFMVENNMKHVYIMNHNHV